MTKQITVVPEVGQAVRVRNRLATVRAIEPYDTTRSTQNWPQRSLPMWQWQEVQEVLPQQEPTGRVVRLMRELLTD
jgi:hypothetical protein